MADCFNISIVMQMIRTENLATEFAFENRTKKALTNDFSSGFQSIQVQLEHVRPKCRYVQRTKRNIYTKHFALGSLRGFFHADFGCVFFSYDHPIKESI